MAQAQVLDQKKNKKRSGRILALDLGTRRVGVAVSDELQLTVRTLPYLHRSNWKALLRNIEELRQRLDVKLLVIGLPLRLDGTEGDAVREARRIARNLRQTLRLPVHLQDERMTSRDVEEFLSAAGFNSNEILERIDSEAAALILRDFLCQFF